MSAGAGRRDVGKSTCPIDFHVRYGIIIMSSFDDASCTDSGGKAVALVRFWAELLAPSQIREYRFHKASRPL